MPFRWAFKMYDKDGNGSIDLGEMIEIIGTLYEMEGVSKASMPQTTVVNGEAGSVAASDASDAPRPGVESRGLQPLGEILCLLGWGQAFSHTITA